MTASSLTVSAKQLSAITESLGSLPGLAVAYLHGSAARGRLHPASDLDIALLFNGPAPLTNKLLSLSADLETIAGRPVHLGILSLENLIYATEVYRHGKEIFCRDEDCRDLFLMQMLSAYVDYNYARREVLDAYLIRENDSDEYTAE